MKRPLLLSSLVAALLGVCGCGSSKPEVPSWFKSNNGGTKEVSKANSRNPADVALRDIQDRLKKLEQKVAALDEAITSVNKSKDDIVKELDKEGVKSSDDLKKPGIRDDERVKRLVDRLLKNRQEYAKYAQMRKEFRTLHEEGKDAKDSLERQVKLAKAGISDKDLEELNVAIKKIEERLDAKDPKNPVATPNSDTIVDSALKKGGF